MKRFMVIVMMVMCMAMNVTVANAAVIGEYETRCILDGTYEVTDKLPRSIDHVNMKEWTDPDVFGNQYRLYRYADDSEGERSESLVCLKHHMTRAERKAWKDAHKK